MSKLSRNKGNAFELKIAKLLIETSNGNFNRKDCYRMPLSGGHPHAGKSDLAMSSAFLKWCPFTVECKHNRDFFDGSILRGRALESGWITQVLKASEETGYAPLLIMTGNNTPIYVAMRWSDTNNILHFEPANVIHFRPLVDEADWVSYDLNYFLSALGKRRHK